MAKIKTPPPQPSTRKGRNAPQAWEGANRRPCNDQIRLNTSVPFVPPNPNEFDSAISIFASRAVCGT